MLGANRNKSAELPIASLALAQCLAKSRKTADGQVLAGRLVLSHCQVVGEVARAMIARMPDWLRLSLFPDGAELIAAAHDIGKVSPTFQHKIYRALTTADTAVLLLLKASDPDTEKYWGGHGGVSQATADALGVGRFIPEILGQHHGFSPTLSSYQASSDVFGGDAVTQAGWSGAVFKHMPVMSATTRTVVLRARQQELVISLCCDTTRQRVVKTRPACHTKLLTVQNIIGSDFNLK